MKILVVIDMQKDFIDGALGSPEAQAIVPNVTAKVKEYAEMENSLIVYTRDSHFSNYMDTMEGKKLPVPHCIYGTEGWNIVPEVFGYKANIAIFDKPTFGYSTLATEINDLVEEFGQTIESFEICGLCTDICVISNALILKAAFYETPITINSNCCAGTTPAQHEAALAAMRSCQIEVV
jgi:nicotinamidase-related amidase